MVVASGIVSQNTLLVLGPYYFGKLFDQCRNGIFIRRLVANDLSKH